MQFYVALYAVPNVTCCIVTAIHYDIDYNYTWQFKQSVATNAAHITEVSLNMALLSQAETCRWTNQQTNNTVQQFGVDSLWI
jgi:hypothetical protein